MQLVLLDLSDGLGGFALNGDHGIDGAGPQFLKRDALLDIDEIWSNSEPLENDSRRYESSAIRKINADFLALEIPEAADRFRRDDVHLFIIKLGYVGELFLDVFGETFFLQIVERVGAHDSKIYALKKQHIGDALDRAAADNREDAQFISVIEH